MFGKNEESKTEQLTEKFSIQVRELESTHKIELANLQNEHALKISELEQSNKLALKEKEFEMKHFKDEEVLALKKELAESNQANAVLQKENEMLQKITDLNGDIIDIKDLVANLIGKLPEFKISSLNVNTENAQSK
jgi:predicted peptidase